MQLSILGELRRFSIMMMMLSSDNGILVTSWGLGFLSLPVSFAWDAFKLSIMVYYVFYVSELLSIILVMAKSATLCFWFNG